MTVALLLALALLAPPAAAPPNGEPAELALIVASNRGSRAGRAPLRYADDDGAKYHEVFATIAGEAQTVLLTDLDADTARLFPALVDRVRSPTRTQLDAAAARLARRSAELRRAGRAVRFHFVFAGHGDVDGGRGFLELADGPFTSEDLQQLLRTVAATESHVILDSCNSFFVVSPRRPGGVRFATPADAAEALSRRLPDVGVFLSTSSQAEVYEWSELQSGVFSHAVRSGLLGAADADGDGRVSYQELAAFVETAVAGIKNPLFRPRLFARGPNGEDGRSILDLPAARTALLVDEPVPVRLALRDQDGLRWLDAHAEAGASLRLWLPPGVRERAEVERLSAGPEGVQVVASQRLPPSGEAPLRLAALRPSGQAVAMRGAGDVFQALFARPFGPAAYAAYLEQRLSRIEELLRLEPIPAPLALAAQAEAGERPPPERIRIGRPEAILRLGGAVLWMDGKGALMGGPGAGGVPQASLALGLPLSRFLAAQLEAGLLARDRTRWTFKYPSPGWTANALPGTALDLRLVPVSLGLELSLPFLEPRPYLVAAGGVMLARAVIDPPGFSSTLRELRAVPFLRAGLGVRVDLTDHLFAGAEARYLIAASVEVAGARLSLSAVEANLLLGVHP